MSARLRIWPRSIRRRLIAGVALIHLCMMTVFVVDLVQRQRRFLLEESLERTRTLATTLAVNSSSWVLANDVVGLQEVVRSLQADPDLRYAMILSSDGRVLAHSRESQQGLWARDDRSLALLGSKAELTTVWSGGDLVDVAAPIRTSTGASIGWARIGMGRTRIAESLAVVSRNGVVYTVAAIVLGSAFAIAVGNRLTKDLEGLVRVSSQVRDGRRDVRAGTDRGDEVAQLGHGLNEMLDALTNGEERIRSLLDSTAEGILGLDLDGRCTFCNPAALSLLGCSRGEELLGRRLYELTHRGQSDGSACPSHECQICALPSAPAEVHVDDEVFWRSDGTGFPVEYRVHPVVRLGVPTGWVLTFSDATKRKEAEEDLRAAGELLERVFDSIHVCVAYLDRDLAFLRVNRAYAAADGREPGEFVGKKHFDLYPNTENEAIFQRVVETGDPYSVVARPFTYSSRPERGVSYWDWRLEPVKEKDGRVHGVILSLLDVTDRVRAEETRAHLAAIIESSADAIIGKDLDGRIRSWNTGAEKMYGFTAAEVVGRPVTMLAPPELNDETVVLTERLRRGEDVGHFETLRVRKDGSRFDVALTLSPIRDDAGTTIGISTIARDITERKKDEEAIRLLNAELEERVRRRTADLELANRELEAFSYSVSHDLRAPLRAIHGFSCVLVEDYSARLDAEGVRLLGVIRGNAERMSHLIDDLLALSRAGRSTIGWCRVDMNELVQTVWNELVALDAVPPSELHLEPLPPAMGDPALLRQVWTNLLSNALKFSSRRQRRVVEVRAASGTGNTIYVVRDNGAGFDMNQAGRLFGVFQRLHSGSDFEGTGVGLAIVQRIVERHGGSVRAEAIVDTGATFSFTLPAGDETPS